MLLTIHCADHSIKPLNEWQLKRSLTDFFKSFFSLTVPEDDIVVRRFKDFKKRKCDDPVAHGALFIHDLGFLSKFSRSEILHGIDGEDDVKEFEKKFLDWRRSVVGKTDGIELNLEGVKFTLTTSVPESDDFGMTKEWEELNAFGNQVGHSRGGRQQQPDTIVLKGVPRHWFAEPRVSSKPSMLVTHTIFSAFGKIRLEFGNVGVLILNGMNNTLLQMHWHSPSEHKINGATFDVELHLVHKASDGRFTVIAILYKIGDADPIISKIQSELAELGKEVFTDEDEIAIGTYDTWKLRRNTCKYYRYVGSLTTPPCTENVTWHIFGKVLTKIQNARGIMDVLSEMLNAIDPGNKEWA
ncbi:unnamed protein product [Camellia sinensis]